MPTRLYLPSTGTTPGITPAVGTGWTATATTGFLRQVAATTKIASALTDHTSASPSATNPSTAVMRQYIFGPLAAQTVSGTLTGIIRGLESAIAHNGTVAINVRQVDSAGAHVADLLAVAASDNTAATPPEFGTTASTRRLQDAAEATSLTLTSRTFTAGQYLVVELGFRKAVTSTSSTVTLRFGDAAATDFAHTDGLTTDLNPWVEFSGTITLVPQATRQVGGLGIQVDVVPPHPTTRLGGLGIMVDYVPGVGGPTLVTVSTTQAQTLALGGSSSLGRSISQAQSLTVRRVWSRTRSILQPQSLTIESTTAIPVDVAATQGTAVALVRSVRLTRTIQQGLLAIGTSGSRFLSVAQSTAVAFVKQVRFTRAIGQAQTATGSFAALGYQLLVATTQGSTVALQRLIRLTRAFQPPRRVKTRVSLARSPTRVLSLTRPTSVRLIRQVRLTRTIGQGQSVSLAGVPVTLQAVAAVQTRSLALERVVSLIRAIVQPTAVYAPGDLALARTVQVPTDLSRQQAVELTRGLEQAQALSLEVLDVTPYYEIVVSLTQGQSLSVTSATGGRTAREFAVADRVQDFVVDDRSGRFATRRRGVRFTVEAR